MVLITPVIALVAPKIAPGVSFSNVCGAIPERGYPSTAALEVKRIIFRVFAAF